MGRDPHSVDVHHAGSQVGLEENGNVPSISPAFWQLLLILANYRSERKTMTLALLSKIIVTKLFIGLFR